MTGMQRSTAIPLLADTTVECVLYVGLGWIERNIEELQRLGFPQPIGDEEERWCAEAVLRWHDAMAFLQRELPPPTMTLPRQVKDSIQQLRAMVEACQRTGRYFPDFDPSA
jgi:hypothetical protein